MKSSFKILGTIIIFNIIMMVNVFAIENVDFTEDELNEVHESVEVENLNSESDDEIFVVEEDVYVNPLYKDLVSEDELKSPSNIMMLSMPIQCSTIEEAGEVLREEMKNRSETVEISYVSNTEMSNISYRVLDIAMEHTGVPTEGDYIRWQYPGWSCKRAYRISGGKYYYTLTYTLKYYTTYEQEREMDLAVSSLLSKLALKGTDYQKVTAIYDYICSNIKYDYDNLDNEEYMLQYTAYAALVNKKAVCQGYAVLFYRLALENGIDARFIASIRSEKHAWNIVKIGDKYYNLDATWDAGKTPKNYNYYLLSDNNFVYHTRDGEYSTADFYTRYPMGSENYTAEKDTPITSINGLVLDKQTGNYLYYENGKINTDFTGLYEYNNKLWYVKNGVVDIKFKGTHYKDNIAYIIENGVVVETTTSNKTEIMKISGIWRMVLDGLVKYTYTGIGTNEKGTWLVKDGTINFDYTGTFKHTDGKTYIIENNKVMTDLNTVMQIDVAWRMIKNGVIEYNYTGIGENEYGSWYIENGVLNFEYTGTYVEGETAYIIEKGKVVEKIAKNETKVMKINNIWRMVENGIVNYNYTGIGENEKGTWLVINGVVDFSYTGNYKDKDGKIYIVEYSQVMTNINEVMKINNIWTMVKNGVIDYTYTGIGYNEKGTWYVEKGIVDFTHTKTYFEGNTAYIIENSKVAEVVTKDTTKVMKVNNIWRMVRNGIVDYTYTGIGTNEKGTWLVTNGVVDFSYIGNYKDKDGKIYIVEYSQVMININSVMKINNVWTMVRNGIVDYTYTGIGYNEKGTWYVENGIVDFTYTGTYFEGNTGYIAENNKVLAVVTKDTTEVMKINGIWRYVRNGVVDYSYTGIGYNDKGTWYVKNGIVDFTYTGTVYVDGRVFRVEQNRIAS